MTAPIAFQGRLGAYSDLACRTAFPGMPTLPCDTFEQAIDAVRRGTAELAMLPCENSLAGRVPDIHSLLPGSGLHIVGEHFQRVEHCLLGPPGADLAGVRRVHSHAVALGQVRDVLRELGAAAQDELLRRAHRGELGGPAWDGMPSDLFFKERVLKDATHAYYSHPTAWSVVGWGGPASPRGYVRMGFNRRDPWEAVELEDGGDEEAVRRENRRVR